MEKCTFNHTSNKHVLSQDFKLLSTQLSTIDSSFFKNFSEALTKERMCNQNNSVNSFLLEEELLQTYNPLSDDHRTIGSQNNKIMLNFNEIMLDDNSLYSFENFYTEENNKYNENNNPIKHSDLNKKGKIIKSTEEMTMEKVKKEVENLKKLKKKNEKNLQKLKRNSLNSKGINNCPLKFLSKKRIIPNNKTENDKLLKKENINRIKLRPKINLDSELNNLNTKIENFFISPNKTVNKKPLDIGLKSRNKSKQDINPIANSHEAKGIELYKKNFHTMPNNKSKAAGELMKNQIKDNMLISLKKKPISRNSLNPTQKSKLSQDFNY